MTLVLHSSSFLPVILSYKTPLLAPLFADLLKRTNTMEEKICFL